MIKKSQRLLFFSTKCDAKRKKILISNKKIIAINPINGFYVCSQCPPISLVG